MYVFPTRDWKYPGLRKNTMLIGPHNHTREHQRLTRVHVLHVILHDVDATKKPITGIVN